MRIAFPAAEYPDVPVERGRVRIGSAEDNGLVLEPESGILPSHMQIEVEARRGIVLTALSEAATIFVNGRPVREKAHGSEVEGAGGRRLHRRKAGGS